jgi:hypothetical protein
MNMRFAKRSVLSAGIYCFIAVIICGQAAAGEAVNFYENNEIDKAVAAFKTELAKEFTDPVTEDIKKAVDVAKGGKVEDAEKAFLPLFENEKTAARARYELGLIYESKGDLNAAVAMLYKAQTVIADKGATFVGISTCKKCHIKIYNSWKKTKMAKAFDVLKPGESAEAKTKLKLDPQKDYTKDTKCLECHTNGFGMPGGYKIGSELAQENEGITCESCHGPGSKFVAIHKDAMTKKQKLALDAAYQAGQHKVDAKSCTVCHNKRNPTAGPDYHFDYEKSKAQDTHEKSAPKDQPKE